MKKVKQSKQESRAKLQSKKLSGTKTMQQTIA
jgi:hypothetical protein